MRPFLKTKSPPLNSSCGGGRTAEGFLETEEAWVAVATLLPADQRLQGHDAQECSTEERHRRRGFGNRNGRAATAGEYGDGKRGEEPNDSSTHCMTGWFELNRLIIGPAEFTDKQLTCQVGEVTQVRWNGQ